ncbi:MAG: sugar transferase [Arcobacter sp.]|nr:MAG: sugar transferase [Arcobacter sp.]
MTMAPIILFVFNRYEHTVKTIEALKKNKLANLSELYIFSDEGRNKYEIKEVEKLRKYLLTVDGFKKIHIIKRYENYGLAKSIIEGVTEIINKYEKVIVLEDDLITSPFFIEYMNYALEFYKNEREIFSISAFNFNKKFLSINEKYSYNVYLHYRPMSWGWATWKNNWDKCDWEVEDYDKFQKNKKEQNEFNKGGNDLTNMLKLQQNGKINSWYIRFCYASFKDKSYTVYPKYSLISNIGHDGTGSHCDNNSNDKYINQLNEELNINEKFFNKNLIIDDKIIDQFNKNFMPPIIPVRILNKLIKVLKKYV